MKLQHTEADMQTKSAATLPPTPARAAEYVRMSTEHQKYSTENQAEIIRRYAESRRIEIVRHSTP